MAANLTSDAGGIDWSSVIATVSLIISGYAALYVHRSTKAAERSADSAKRSADEAALTRLDRRAVSFTLENRFDGLSAKLLAQGEPGLLFEASGRQQRAKKEAVLELHASAPVRDVKVIFELSGETPIRVPDVFSEVAKQWEVKLSAEDVVGEVNLMIEREGVGIGYAILNRWTLSFPHIAPNGPRIVEVPDGLIAHLFLVGLQNWELMRQGEYDLDRTLTVTIAWKGSDGEPGRQAFEYRAVPQGYAVPALGEATAYLWGTASIIGPTSVRPG